MSYLHGVITKASLTAALVVATLTAPSPAFAEGDTTTVFRYHRLPADKNCLKPSTDTISPPLMIKCQNLVVQACSHAGGIIVSKDGKSGCAMQSDRLAKYDEYIRRGGTGPYNPIPREQVLAPPSRPGGCVLRPGDKGDCNPRK